MLVHPEQSDAPAPGRPDGAGDGARVGDGLVPAGRASPRGRKPDGLRRVHQPGPRQGLPVVARGQQTIARLGPGDAFGEIGLVDRRAQDLFAEALDEVVVCRTSREAFLRLCSRDPALAIRLAEAMGEKLQDAREQIADFAFRDVRGRVAHLTLTFLERERRLAGSDDIDRVVFGLSHRELADMIGTRRESVTLSLNSLEREGYVRVEGRTLIVEDLDGLREIAEA